MKYKIRRYNKFRKVIVLSPKENTIESLRKELEERNIYKDREFKEDNICIIYNLNNISKQNREEVNKIVEYCEEMNKNKKNNKIIIIRKTYQEEIYIIGNNVILHNSVIKHIIKRETITKIFGEINVLDINNKKVKAEEYLKEFIRLIVTDIEEKDILDESEENLRKIKEELDKFVTKGEHRERKLISVQISNNIVLVNLYKKNEKKIYMIDNNDIEQQVGGFMINNDDTITRI